jgi:hypothetical protein
MSDVNRGNHDPPNSNERANARRAIGCEMKINLANKNLQREHPVATRIDVTTFKILSPGNEKYFCLRTVALRIAHSTRLCRSI